MERTTAIERIDWVLEFFATSPFVKGGINYDFILKKVRELHPELSLIDDWGDQLNQILEQLELDGYVKHLPQKLSSSQTADGSYFTPVIRQKEQYKPTFKGNFFYSKKGYQGEIDSENAVVRRQATEDQRNKYLFVVTVFVGIGTTIAGVYYSFELFDFYRSHSLEWQLCAYFLSGFSAGLLLWLTVWLIRKITGNKEEQRT